MQFDLTCSIIRFPNGLLSAPRFIIISMQRSVKPKSVKMQIERTTVEISLFVENIYLNVLSILGNSAMYAYI